MPCLPGLNVLYVASVVGDVYWKVERENCGGGMLESSLGPAYKNQEMASEFQTRELVQTSE